MVTLQEKLASQIPQLREDIKSFIKKYGSTVISEVTIAQAYGGMRGVKGMVCDTSLVNPNQGLSVRGNSILKLKDRTPEEIFYLLLTGELPSAEALTLLQNNFRTHAEVPQYVWDVLSALPKDSHPMAMLSVGIMAMERESEFRKRYAAGMNKTDYWIPALQDAITVLGRMTGLAAGIYRMRFDKGDRIAPRDDLDWSGNFAHMLGVDDPNGDFANLMRLYLVLHCDHEGGNVSANTCHVVGSALSDPFYAVAAGLNGLAGPLHGLANQMCLKFVLGIQKKYGGVPTDEQLREYSWKKLETGVIPGYGHAVLRTTDPRYTAFHEFGLKYCSASPVFQIVDKLFKVVPDVLKKHGKAKSPWPNVDAASGSLLYHYGVTEFSFYTVFFGVSRAMGMLSQLVVNRAMGAAITRPKSVSTTWMRKMVDAIEAPPKQRDAGGGE